MLDSLFGSSGWKKLARIRLTLDKETIVGGLKNEKLESHVWFIDGKEG